MVPQIFIEVEQLPLMASGKIDRTRPESQFSGYLTESRSCLSNKIIFESEQEALMADIWQEVLKVNHIRRNDNFFKVGGDSIRTLQVIASLQKHNITLQAEDFFEYPTIAELVTKIISTQVQTSDLVFVDSGPVGPAQAWFLYQNLPQENIYYWEVTLNLTQQLETKHLPAVVEALCKRHAALATAFRCENGRRKQYPQTATEIDGDDEKNVHLISCSVEEWYENKQVRMQPIVANLDIRQGRLLQLAVVGELGSAGQLVFIIHHLAVDLLSIDILLQDFTRIYPKRYVRLFAVQAFRSISRL
ncbi:condensation domain-containing protein [Colwellia sp. MSW7]|uniref:Condensation domain-containing protein n=1 Tax=Colwellia maritima TaxID=2912588 RepID=A0ABS9X7E1_9GAMM|nr:condensation domain-containing protein [Colwellia maritima]MCI2286148.1 condensation domain-containing protein [Colwellia maritima]